MTTGPRRLRLVSAPPPPQAAEPGPVTDLDGAFRAHSRYVGHIALRILGRPDDVDDLVQDVFLDAHGRIGSLRDPGALRGWLATLTVRKAVRALRRRRVRAFLGLDDGFDYGVIADEGASPHDRALVRELYEMLDTLPASERSAWVLRYVEGEKLDRVAELCGCSLATAKRRVAAAQALLQGGLSDA